MMHHNLDVAGQNVSQTSTAMGKFQPRRSHPAASTAASEPSRSEFHFMPTPRIIPATTDLSNANGPPPDVPDDMVDDLQQTHSFSFDNMVDDLQQIRDDEQLRKKSKRAKSRRHLRR
ncbi:hypothetical protein Adt_29550 [Abeliophyllum distichum]|uniref:Uncharacterized protein n=1 Tax=Abeliophyllum distichum TaxID=126358 RepID=A0ABD1RC56_9LAMI